jgi:hypothetical protein
MSVLDRSCINLYIEESLLWHFLLFPLFARSFLVYISRATHLEILQADQWVCGLFTKLL